MFSNEDAYKPEVSLIPDNEDLFRHYLNLFCEKRNLCGGLLCLYDKKLNDFSVISEAGIPDHSFNGSNKNELSLVLEDCFNRFSKPHIHSIHNTAFWNRLSSLIDTTSWQPSISYLPLYARNKSFIFIGFSNKSKKMEMTEEFMDESLELIDIISYILAAEETTWYLKIMEFYVKEVGHDIASSVQAIVAKLRTVSKGLIDGKMAIDKIKEAEDEIMAAYRIADTLGIVVDPDYNIQSGKDFDVIKTINTVVRLCTSEANERHIELRPHFLSRSIVMWGDEKALQ